jgi:soluble lytic murein transglycosylase-like protein
MRYFYMLIAVNMVVWIVLTGLVLYLAYRSGGGIPVFAQTSGTPGPMLLAAIEPGPQPDLLYPPTWTPTVTSTPTSTPTRVPTYPPWATWTPSPTWPATATFTPQPAAVLRKKKAIRTYQKIYKEIAAEYGLDWRLMIEQGYYESGLNPRALGKDNDMGLMQIIPGTWNRIAAQVKVSDPYDPYSNVLVAAVYLRDARVNCKEIGQPVDRCMLLAYNWGITNTKLYFLRGGTWENIPYRQQMYVYNIMRNAGYE